MKNKYAICGPKGAVFNITDTPPESIREGMIVHEVTPAQATKIQAGKESTPLILYFILDNELVESKDALNRLMLAGMDEQQKEMLAARQAAKKIYEQAATLFSTLTVGEKIFWEPVRTAVATALEKGNIQEAREILQTIPSVGDNFVAIKDSFLQLF